jgi:hypothetical protein
LAQLSCDEGIEQTELLIFDGNNIDPIWKFNYHDFMKMLQDAFEKLKKANQIE